MTQRQVGRKRANHGRGTPITPAASPRIRRTAGLLVVLMSVLLVPTSPAAAVGEGTVYGEAAPNSEIRFGTSSSCSTTGGWVSGNGLNWATKWAVSASMSANGTGNGSIALCGDLAPTAAGEGPACWQFSGRGQGVYQFTNPAWQAGSNPLQARITDVHWDRLASEPGFSSPTASMTGRYALWRYDSSAWPSPVWTDTGKTGVFLAKASMGPLINEYCVTGSGVQATSLQMRVALVEQSNAAPGAPTLVAPAPQHTFTDATQVFTVNATDPDGDRYVAEIEITSPSGKTTTYTEPAASQSNSSGRPVPPLPIGPYAWRARACDHLSAPQQCSPWSAVRTFSVGQQANQAPGTPALVSPADNHTFSSTATQTFTVNASDPELDNYVATVEILSGGSSHRTVASSSTISGQNASVTISSPKLAVGSYTWRAKACAHDNATKCSAWSQTRSVGIDAAVPANQPPGTPAQMSPANGHQFAQGQAQTFVVNAVDPENDAYTATVRVTPSTGGVPVEFKSGSTPSGSNASASPPQPLPQGSYTWDARACSSASSNSCSAWSPTRSFTVAGTSSTTNRAPEALEIVAPVENGVFDAGERQDFVLKATDPDGDMYSGTIRFHSWPSEEERDEWLTTAPAPSGMTSIGTFGGATLPPGTYRMDAQVTDVHGASAGRTQLFGVASPAVNPCASSTPLVDGWFGDRYLRLATSTIADVGYLCVRTAQGGLSSAGWLRAETGSGGSGGGPSIGTSTACPDGVDGVFPLLDLGTGQPPNQPNHLWARLRTTGASVTACFKVKAGGSNLLDTALTITAPEGASLSDLNFIPEQSGGPGDWTPSAPVAPPAGLPSSECYAASSGKTQLVNASVDGQHTWLFHQTDATGSKLCARVQGAQQRGVVVRAPSGAGGAPLYALTTGRPANDTGPCTETELHGEAPAVVRLRHTTETADPLGVCLYVGTGTSGGLSAWLTVGRSPDAPIPTVQPDP